MALVRWAPFSAFTSLEREMQTMLDRFGGFPPTAGWKPVCDVHTTEDGDLLATFELPGIDPADLSVEFQDGMLRIAGEKREIREIDEGSRHVRERRYGSFKRDLMLPDGVDVEAIEAIYGNGVLTVKVPIPAPVEVEEAKAKPIKITIEKKAPADL